MNGVGLGREMISLCGVMLEDNERVCVWCGKRDDEILFNGH